jgi:hypothetical protein
MGVHRQSIALVTDSQGDCESANTHSRQGNGYAGQSHISLKFHDNLLLKKVGMSGGW